MISRLNYDISRVIHKIKPFTDCWVVVTNAFNLTISTLPFDLDWKWDNCPLLKKKKKKLF